MSYSIDKIINVNTTNVEYDDFIKNSYNYIKNFCYNDQYYNYGYWRDAARMGALKANYIYTNKNLTNIQIQKILENINCYESIGIIDFCRIIENGIDLFNNIIILNPYKENIISEAYISFFLSRDSYFGDNIISIKNYPTQLEKFIDFIKIYEPESLSDDIARYNILLHLLGNEYKNEIERFFVDEE